MSSRVRRWRWKRKISFGCKSHEKYSVEKCLEGWGMVIKCGNKGKCYSPRAESTRINQATGAAETYPRTAPTDMGTQSQWCHNCQRLPRVIPKNPNTCLSQRRQLCKHRCFCLWVLQQLTGYQSIRNESMYDLPPQNFPPVLYRQC